MFLAPLPPSHVSSTAFGPLLIRLGQDTARKAYIPPHNKRAVSISIRV